ncbi:hypothetical protein ACF0H5_002696 [Mactra antiquata]
MSGISVFCIANVSSPPLSLNRRKETGAFYCHLSVPVQEQLVIFSEGDWDIGNDVFNVTLTYRDDEIELGKISQSSRCLIWKRADSAVPESMTRETEQGLAKLVLEREEIVQEVEIIKPTVQEENENTPQITDETNSTPDRPKKRRKGSVEKDDVTPNGPAKKKTRKNSLPTRLRSQTDENSPKTDTITDNGGEKRKTKSDKVLNEVKNKNSPKSENISPRSNSRKVNSDKITSDGTDIDKNIVSDKNVDSKSEKSSRRKSDVQKKEKLNEIITKDKRTRKTRKESDLEDANKNSDNDLSLLDKENIQVDNNIPAQDKTLKPAIPQKLSSEEEEKLLTVSNSGKTASCKDITLRALDRPSGRWGHSLCFVNKNLSVLIGGQGDKQQISKDSVWSLDCETRRWKDLPTETEGQKPEYRMGHTATYDPTVRCIYVYGGSKNTRWFHDVHMLDTDNWKWQLVKVNGKAPTRAYHSATLYRHEVWIFGGVYPRPDPQPDGCSNEVNIFSPVMESWYSPIVSGEKPIPRSGHSATLINDQLVIFGGWDAPISYSDLHVLDMSIVEWSQPHVSGTPPSPRSWHASCALSNNRLLIHGGYNGDFALEDTHIFNLDELNWCRIVVENKPSARVGHKALCMPYRHDNEEEDEVIIFGGGDNDGAYFDDIYSLYIPFKPVTLV